MRKAKWSKLKTEKVKLKSLIPAVVKALNTSCNFGTMIVYL